MPYGGFKCVEPTLNGLYMLTETSNIGHMFEVNIAYPNHLHDEHNDFPFLPDNSNLGSSV